MNRFTHLLISLSLLICSVAFARDVSVYEYWFDTDCDAKVTGELSNGIFEEEIQVASLQKGLHSFNLRVQSSDSVWGSVFRHHFFVPSSDANVSLYEYWIDSDIASKKQESVNGESVMLQLDSLSLPKGLHSFNIRLKDNHDTWGSVHREFFYVEPSANHIEAYEYWIDNDIASKKQGAVNGESIMLQLDSLSLPKGLHSFNIRLKDNHDTWGSVHREFFYIDPTATHIEAYEYWIDSDIASKKQGSVNGESVMLQLDSLSLPKGLHSFNIRLKDNHDTWGSVHRKFFYADHESNAIDSYEYWIDGDRTDVKTGSFSGGILNLDIKLDSIDEKTPHSFSLRLRDTEGKWGTPLRRIFKCVPNPDKRVMLGFKHWINDRKMGYEEFSAKDTLVKYITIDVPADLRPSRRGANYVFDGDKVSYSSNDSIWFTLQLETETGWSEPERWHIPMGDSHETTAIDMTIPSYLTLQKPAASKFHAVRFTTDGEPVYMRSDQEVELELYRNGERMDSIGGRELKDIKEVTLPSGTYYGILHSAPINDENPADSLTFHLMDTANKLRMPEIAFNENDSTVTINPMREGAVAYYTIDGTIPTAEAGIQYTAKFKLNHNATVKAIATLPGLDIEDSDVATLNVDVFKVDAPIIAFSDLHVVITQSKEEGVSTRYTLDGGEPTEESELYTAPISLSANVTVRARSFKQDWNPSDITDFIYTHSTYVTAAPAIGVEGNTVTITAADAGSKVWYGVNDADPAKMQEYTAPFTIDRACVIHAQARKEGLFPSEVVSHEVKAYRLTYMVNNAVYKEFDLLSGISITPEPEPTKEGHTFSGWQGLPQTMPAHDVTVTGSFSVNSYILTYMLDGEMYAEYSVEYGAAITPEPEPTKEGHTFSGWDNVPETMPAHDVTVSGSFMEKPYSAKPQISYDGRFVTMGCEDREAEILFTIDEADMGQATEYGNSFDAKGLHTIRAFTVRDGFNDSETSALEILAYSDDEHAEIAEEGHLAEAFSWMPDGMLESITDYSFSGPLDANGYATIRSMKAMQNLDLTEVTSKEMPDESLKEMDLLTVKLPKATETYGEGIFSGNGGLCAIFANSTATIPAAAFGDFRNPNLLLYLTGTEGWPQTSAVNPAEGIDWLTNVITDGETATIPLLTLTDAMPYFCPKDFMADEIRFTKSFSKRTSIGDISGWETMAVPFNVSKIRKGEFTLVPFKSYSGDEATRPFWLYRPNQTGWDKTDAIEAHIPYLISMPNNEAYDPSYNITGEVTFIGDPQVVIATQEAEGFGWKAGQKMWANFSRIPAEEGIFVVNDNGIDGHVPGEVFVEKEHDVRPFECYVTASTARKVLAIFDTSDIETLRDFTLEIWSEKYDLFIRPPYTATFRIHDLNGQLVRIVKAEAGAAVRVADLTPGIYFVGDRKVLVK